MAINRPLTVDQPSLANMTTGRGEGVGHRWDERLHTHHNQVRNPRAPLSAVLTLRLLRKDGFGDSVFICYAILPLYDMNEKTGATSIAPGSHTPENVAYINNYRRENAEALKDTSVSRHDIAGIWVAFFSRSLPTGPGPLPSPLLEPRPHPGAGQRQGG